MAAGAAPMAVGGIVGTVQIDTSGVAKDLDAVLQALKAVDAVLTSATGTASGFAAAFQHQQASMSQATVATHAVAAATDTYAVAAINGASAAHVHAQAMHGFSVAAVQGRSAAQMFADTVDDGLDAARRAAIDWGRTSTVMHGMTDGDMQRFGHQATVATDAAAKGAKNANYQFMAMAYLVDDMQYVGEQGLRPIINNVMMFDARIGLALITAKLFYDQLGNLRDLGEGTWFGGLIDGMDEFVQSHVVAAKAIAEIGGWLDFSDPQDGQRSAAAKKAEAKRAKNSENMADRLGGLQTDEQRKAAQAATEAIAAMTGGAKALRDVLLSQATRGRTDEQLNKEVKDPAGNRITMRELLTRRVDQMLDEAMKGQDGAIGEIGRANPEFARRFAGASGKEARDKANREADELTKQGKEFEFQGKEDTRKENERKVKEYARDLQKSVFDAILSGQAVSRDTIKSSLAASGTDVSEEVAKAIFDELNRGFSDAVQKKSREMGGALPAQAIDAMRQEAELKEDPLDRHERLGRDREVRRGVKKTNPMVRDLMAAMSRRKRKGQDDAGVDSDLASQVRDRTDAWNLDPEVQEEVISATIRNARDRFEGLRARQGNRGRAMGGRGGVAGAAVGRVAAAEGRGGAAVGPFEQMLTELRDIKNDIKIQTGVALTMASNDRMNS